MKFPQAPNLDKSSLLDDDKHLSLLKCAKDVIVKNQSVKNLLLDNLSCSRGCITQFVKKMTVDRSDIKEINK